nr:hypothetical protein [Stenotrophomonas pavanii]
MAAQRGRQHWHVILRQARRQLIRVVHIQPWQDPAFASGGPVRQLRHVDLQSARQTQGTGVNATDPPSGWHHPGSRCKLRCGSEHIEGERNAGAESARRNDECEIVHWPIVRQRWRIGHFSRYSRGRPMTLPFPTEYH